MNTAADRIRQQMERLAKKQMALEERLAGVSGKQIDARTLTGYVDVRKNVEVFIGQHKLPLLPLLVGLVTDISGANVSVAIRKHRSKKVNDSTQKVNELVVNVDESLAQPASKPATRKRSK